MVAILCCPADHNQVFEELESSKRGEEYLEFLPLLCVVCRCIVLIEKKAIKKDGNIWKYV